MGGDKPRAPFTCSAFLWFVCFSDIVFVKYIFLESGDITQTKISSNAFNQGVRDSNSRGRTKKHQTVLTLSGAFFMLSFG